MIPNKARNKQARFVSPRIQHRSNAPRYRESQSSISRRNPTIIPPRSPQFGMMDFPALTSSPPPPPRQQHTGVRVKVSNYRDTSKAPAVALPEEEQKVGGGNHFGTEWNFPSSNWSNRVESQRDTSDCFFKAGDGTQVENMRGDVMKDKQGIVGLLWDINGAEKTQRISHSLELKNLGMNLNYPRDLVSTFSGPLKTAPDGAPNIEFPVPPEYSKHTVQGEKMTREEFIHHRQKLHNMKLKDFRDDTLFYIFYTFARDELQMRAARVLFERNWRYHMEEQIWMTRMPGVKPVKTGLNYEKGMYFCFDPIAWRQVTRSYHLDYSKIEGPPPQLPPIDEFEVYDESKKMPTPDLVSEVEMESLRYLLGFKL